MDMHTCIHVDMGNSHSINNHLLLFLDHYLFPCSACFFSETGAQTQETTSPVPFSLYFKAGSR